MSPDKKTTKLEYKNSKGETKKWEIIVYDEDDVFLKGIALPAAGYRTFRKDRIVRMLSDNYKIPEHPARTWVRKPKAEPKLEVCFTGFDMARRVMLEAMAAEHGLLVRKSVTTQLDYLVAGRNAGPAKLAKAEDQGVLVLDDYGFQIMLHTGDEGR